MATQAKPPLSETVLLMSVRGLWQRFSMMSCTHGFVLYIRQARYPDGALIMMMIDVEIVLYLTMHNAAALKHHADEAPVYIIH